MKEQGSGSPSRRNDKGVIARRVCVCYELWVDSRVTLIKGTGSLVSGIAKIRYRVDAAVLK